MNKDINRWSVVIPVIDMTIGIVGKGEWLILDEDRLGLCKRFNNPGELGTEWFSFRQVY